jgi:hypothetical protein
LKEGKSCRATAHLNATMQRSERPCATGALPFVLAFLGFLAFPLRAQIPEKFENLKVLPADITRPQLLQVMRGFALGLGVRCQFCHVGEEGQPLSTFDFKSDEKPTKRTARVMLRMVHDINESYLSQLDTISPDHMAMSGDHDHADHIEVQCATAIGEIPVPR